MDALKEQAVFREFARSWVKRNLIENAIEIVSPLSDQLGEKRDVWNAGQHETHGQDEIDAVTRLTSLERFVLVMSILERHSHSDCALLLGCNTNKVAQARRTALRRLAEFAGVLLPRGRNSTLHHLEASA